MVGMFKDKVSTKKDMYYYIVGNDGEEKLVLAENVEQAIQLYYNNFPQFLADEVNVVTACHIDDLIK